MLKPTENSDDSCPDNFLQDACEIPQTLHLRIAKRRARAAGLSEPHVQAGSGNESASTEIESIMEALERIHLKPDFLPARFLRDGSQRARAVCRIIGPRCSGTAFLIAQGLLITNNHVLGTADFAAKCKAEFDFEDGKSERSVTIQPDKVFITSRALDYTIVACDGTPLKDIVPIPLKQDPTLVAERERVNIIQHPKARKKEVAIHENRVEKRLDRVIRYRTDTDRGSSGAPVFNNQWELVALHHAGCNLANNEALNEGVLISAIVSDLNAKLNDAQFGTSAKLVVPHLENLSPLTGCFHLSGILSNPSDANVGTYTGDRRFTDIGFWELEGLSESVSDSQVETIAEIVRKLNLDILGLSRVEKNALDRMVREARARSLALDYLVPSVNSERDLALIFNTDSTRAQRLTDSHSAIGESIEGHKVFTQQPLIAKFNVTEIDGDSTEFIVVALQMETRSDSIGRRCRTRASEILVEFVDQLRQDHGLPVILGGDFHQEISANVLGAIQNKDDLIFATVRDSSGASFVVGRNSLIKDIITTRDQRVVNIEGGETGVTRLDRSLPLIDPTVSNQRPVVFRIVMDQPNRERHSDENETSISTPDTQIIRVPAGTKEIRIQFE